MSGISDILGRLKNTFFGTTDKVQDYKPTLTPTPTETPPKTVEEWYSRGYDKKFPESTKTLPTLTPTPTPKQGFDYIPGYTNGPVPVEYVNNIRQATQNDAIRSLLASVFQTESGFNTRAYNNGDYGPGQIHLASHPDVTEQQAYDPRFSTEFMNNYLNNSYGRLGDWAQAIASYNVGGGRVGPGEGRDSAGLGPAGRQYLNKVVRNLDPTVLQQLGLLPSY